jgi:TPR repeat protein
VYDQDDKPKKSKLGCLLKVAVMLIVLGAGAYFCYWYYLKWQDDRAWEAALQKRTIVGYQGYIRERPEGRHVMSARTVIDRFEKKRAKEAAKEEAAKKKVVTKEKAEKKPKISQRKMRDNLAWSKALSANSIAGYEDYRRSFPDGKFVKQAEAVIGNLKKTLEEKKATPEEKAWKIAEEKGTIDALESFILEFPDGKRVPVANTKLFALKEAQDAPKRDNAKGMSSYAAGNFNEAIEAFSRAGAKGYAPSLFNLGYVFEEGKGVERDLHKAAEWYEKAASLGDPDAQVNYGYMLEQGQGVEKSFGKAASWYAKAAAQEHGLGRYNLGVLYARGRGVPKDLKKALKLFQDAADSGVPEAAKSVKLIEKLVPKSKPAVGAIKP